MIVFILSFDPFLVDLLVLCPPENAGWLLVFWFFQGPGGMIRILVILYVVGQSIMIAFGWWCSHFMPSEGAGKRMESKYIGNKSEDINSKQNKKKSIASTEKVEKVF